MDIREQILHEQELQKARLTNFFNQSFGVEETTAATQVEKAVTDDISKVSVKRHHQARLQSLRSNVADALDVLSKAGTEDLFEKARVQRAVGTPHPSNPNILWTDLGNGKFDWKSKNGKWWKGKGAAKKEQDVEYEEYVDEDTGEVVKLPKSSAKKVSKHTSEPKNSQPSEKEKQLMSKIESVEDELHAAKQDLNDKKKELRDLNIDMEEEVGGLKADGKEAEAEELAQEYGARQAKLRKEISKQKKSIVELDAKIGELEEELSDAKKERKKKPSAKIDTKTINQTEYDSAYEDAMSTDETSVVFGLGVVKTNIKETQRKLEKTLASSPGSKATIDKLQKQLTKLVSQKKAAEDALKNMQDDEDLEHPFWMKHENEKKARAMKSAFLGLETDTLNDLIDTIDSTGLRWYGFDEQFRRGLERKLDKGTAKDLALKVFKEFPKEIVNFWKYYDTMKPYKRGDYRNIAAHMISDFVNYASRETRVQILREKKKRK